MKTEPTKMQQQILTLRANIATANKERCDQLLKLADAPADGALHEMLAAIESDIVEYTRALARLEASEAEAARRQSKEARKAEYEHLKAVRARLAGTNGKTEALAAKLQAAFEDTLGPLIAQLQLAIEERAADARAILVATRGQNFHAQSEGQVSQLVNFETGEVRESFANLVARTGLASTAIRLDPFITVTAPSQLSAGAKIKLGDAVAKANGKLIAAIDNSLEAGKKMLLGSAHA